MADDGFTPDWDALTEDGASGELEGAIPHKIGRVGEDFSHHCTNMGIDARHSQT